MKFAVAACAFLLVVLVSAIEISSAEEFDFPANEGMESEISDVQESDEPSPRITCDLLSPTKWNHALCAAHCLLKGYRGGYCDNKGVCNCRR